MKSFFVLLELLNACFLFQGVNANSEGIRGTPGVDYPTFFEIPVTSFRCSDQKYTPGFYADPETGCQVFHYCYNNRQESYLCPTGTIFNQAILACDYWYSSNCVGAASLYHVNNNYQSRALLTDFGDGDTSGDFGIDAKPHSEPMTSNVHYETLNVKPTEEDKNKLNQVIASFENILPKQHSNEAEEKHKLNIAANENLHEDNKKNVEGQKFLGDQSPTEEGAKQKSVFENTKTVDEYDRYPQSVASSGPASPPLTNISDSVYEKLANLQDTNSRLPKNENDREYTEEQLRGLIEEIRDYEHEIRSERDKNYMFRPHYLEKDTEDDFSGLNESEFNSKLTENSNYDYSKINIEDGSEKFVSEIEYDYDDSNANEDRLRYLHNLRVRDLHASYSSNSKQDSTELNLNDDSNQQSMLPTIDVDAGNTNTGSFQTSDMETFSKRFSVTERNKNKTSRRDPIYVASEVVNQAPKFLPKKKRQRNYPFGIQETDEENPTATEANVGNKTLNVATEEIKQTEKRVISNPETLDTSSLNINTDQTENWNVPSEEGYVSGTEYNEKTYVSQGNVHETTTDSTNEQSDDFQYHNPYVFERNEFDSNRLHDSEQGEWIYAYPQNDFSDFENQERIGISRIEYLRGVGRLPSNQEYDSPLFETNVENIPESTHDEYFSSKEYPGEDFDTFDYSNTLSPLNNNQRKMYYPEVYSEKQDTNADSIQTYQEELVPTYSSDVYTNFNINRDAGKEKKFGSLHENAYRDEISDINFENIQDQNVDERTAKLDLYSSEQKEESSLRDEKDQSEDSETFSEDNFGNIPPNMYMDPEGNLFHYVESEMAATPEKMYGVTPNDARLYLKNTNRLSNIDTVNSSELKTSFQDDQNSDSEILEDEPNGSFENIKKTRETEFDEFTSQEFSEADISNIKYNKDDSVTENDSTGPHFSTEEQNEYKDELNEDSFQEEIYQEESQKVSSGEDYQFRKRPQNIFRDPNGNIFYYVDTETPQDPESAYAPASDLEFQVERNNFSGTSFSDSGLLLGNTAEGGLQSNLNTPEGEVDVVTGETYTQNIIKEPDAEFSDYVNSQNIYTDSEGNMFYYVNTELSEDSESLAENLNVMTSDPLSSDFAWRVKSVDGQNFPLSHFEDGKLIIDPEATDVEDIMKMSEAEVQEYLNSQLPEVNDIPDTQYSKYYAKNKKRQTLSSQDAVGFKDNFEDMFKLPVGEFKDTVQKWPNRFELLDSNSGVSEKSFPGRYVHRGEGFGEGILQKRVETDFEEGSSEENNDFVNSQNIYTDSSGNMFYYYPEMAEDEENLEDEPHSMPLDGALDPDFSPEKIFSGSQKSAEADKSHDSLDEAYAKKIMEMSDTEFQDYLNSQGLTKELPLYEQQNKSNANLNEEGLQEEGTDSQDDYELAQEYDIRNNPQNIYVDSQGNMYYFAIDAEQPVDPEDFDSAAESNLESVINLNSNESNLPLENEFADSTNLSSTVLEENERDPAAEEAYLKNIMKMSDEEFGVYLSSQEFKEVTDTPDILSDENEPFKGEQYSESQWSPEQDSMTGFEQSSFETEKSIANESYESQANGKDDSNQEQNTFESGTESQGETLDLSSEIQDSKPLRDESHIATDSSSKQISESLNSETAVESVDVNNDAQDELYGDFSDLFAALTKDPEIKDQETKENLKLESIAAQGKTSTGSAQKIVESTGHTSSGNEFDEQTVFKPLEQPSSPKGFGANSMSSNLKPGRGNHFSEFPQFTQSFNSFQFQGGSPYQQYVSPYSSQPVLKKSLQVQQIREPTFGRTLRSMKNSKLQMLGLYAKALRQRLF